MLLTQSHGYIILSILAQIGYGLYLRGFEDDAREKYDVPFPDMGSGRFAIKLSDEDWKRFNCIIRTANQNIVLNMVSSVISGVFRPKASLVLTLLGLYGRHQFNIDCMSEDPERRMRWIPLTSTCTVVQLVIALFGVYKLFV